MIEFRGQVSPILLFYMVQKNQIKEIISNLIDGTELFIVDIIIRPGNGISVLVDSIKGVTIDEIATLSKSIDSILDRDAEDFELEVSSPGLSHPFKVSQQYYKNIGRDIEILSNNGQKYIGKLLSVNSDDFTVEIQNKIKPVGRKKPEMVTTQQQFKYDEVKSTKIVINF